VGDAIPALIDQLAAGDWQLLRTLRLAALQESPDAFSPTFEQTSRFDDARWQAAAENFGCNPRAAMFIARPDLGLCSAVMDDDGEATSGHIGAMWVHPEARGLKLGSALLHAALEFLAGCNRVVLTVTETNTPARVLYESRGFRLTGSDELLRPGSPLKNLEMLLERASPGR